MDRGPGFFDVDEPSGRSFRPRATWNGRGRSSISRSFRADLERAVPRERAPSKGCRPPYDHVLMFRVLILQSSHSLSDEGTEYLIKDRLSFMRFLGLSLAGRELDLELSRGADSGEDRRQAGDRGFVQALRRGADEGRFSRDGRTDHRRHHDLSRLPKQRNSPRPKRRTLREGRVPEDWKRKPPYCARRIATRGWTVKYSKAKLHPRTARSASIWRSPPLATRTILASTAPTA